MWQNINAEIFLYFCESDVSQACLMKGFYNQTEVNDCSLLQLLVFIL